MIKKSTIIFLFSVLLNGFLIAQIPIQILLIDEKSDYPVGNPLYRRQLENEFGKMGFVNQQGREVIPYQFDFALPFKGDSAFVKDNKTQKWGIIDKTGKLVMPYQFDNPFEWNNDCFKYAFVEKHHDCIYEIEDFGIARINGKLGIINRQGKWLIIPQFEDPRYFGIIFKNGYAVAGKDGKSGLINRKGEVILPFIYDFIGLYNNGLINVGISRNGFKTGCVNLKNEVVIPLIYNDLSNFEDGFAYASKRVKNEPLHDSLILVTDKIPTPYYVIDSVNRYGIIDTTGKVIVPFQYTRVMFANDGLFAVQEGKTDGKWGFINAQNQIVIPFQFDMMINPFYNGVAIVTKTINGVSKYFSIDKTGKCVKDCP
jgi:hypothetical protein